MAIIQISKLQQRSGNLVDLPQLDDAEFGWATDSGQLYIGKGSPAENIEVLTSYSNISFSQITDSGGNIFVSAAQDGQILAFDGDQWVNRGGASGGLLDLGSISNVKIGGGATGYVLETDGLGSLSWTSKGTLRTNIVNLTPITTTGSIATTVVSAGSFVIGRAYSINSTGTTTDWFVAGALSDAPGTVFVAKTIGAGDGTADLTTLTVTNVTSGVLTVNTYIIGASIGTGVYIAALGSGSGGIGTYYLSEPLTVLSESIAGALVMTVANTTPYVNAMQVTVSGAAGTNTSIVNGQSFFIRVDANFSAPTLSAGSGNVSFFSDPTLLTPIDGTGLVYTANGVATTALASGTITAAGSDKSIQYNQGSILQGSPAFTFDYLTNQFTVSGNANVGNLSSYRLFSNVATGVTPITVVSTTRVPNLNVSYANVSDYVVTTAQSTGTFYPTFVNGSTTANYALGSNSSLSFNAATGTLSSTLLTGTLTTAAQPNVTSTGTLTSLIVTGTATAGNLTTGGTLSVTGNANVGNLGTTGLVVATGNVTGGNLVTGGALAVTGNANVGNLGTSGLVVATGNVTGGNLVTGGALAVTGNANVGNLGASAGVFTGTLSVTGNANVGNLGTSGLVVATGNISGGNVNAGNLLTANYLTGTLTTAAQPNITSVGTLSSLTTTIITSGATATAGTITGNWALAAGSKLNATYADLAEYYEADATYDPGTVLMFGGDKEVTLASDATNKVAGVVSTNPAYLMNSLCPGAYTAAIALQGRAPCRVRGTIRKGDMLIAGGDGFARPSASPLMGTVIGKSLEDFNGVSGIIECAVGRL